MQWRGSVVEGSKRIYLECYRSSFETQACPPRRGLALLFMFLS